MCAMIHRPVAAFFDVDQTLLTVNSATLYTRYLVKKGRLPQGDLLRTAWAIVLHRLNRLDALALSRRALKHFDGQSLDDLLHESKEWFRSMVVPHISADAVEAVRAHQEAGHRVMLLSASTQFVCNPLVDHLGIDGAICTQVGARNGKLTGKIDGIFCYGPGKREAVENFATRNGVNLAASYFYTDSITDLPALEAVGHPVAINADRYLLREARTRAWPIRRWRRAGEPNRHDRVREERVLRRAFEGRNVPRA